MVQKRALVLVAACGTMLCVAVFVARSGGNSDAALNAAPPEIVSIGESQCAFSLVMAGLDTATAGVNCVSLDSPSNLQTVAGFASQMDGLDTIIINPALPDDPDTTEPENRVDQECPGDTNGDGIVCGPRDIGVDDASEVRHLIDLRDDGLLDGKYTLRAADFADVDVEANHLHEIDGRLWILYFVDSDASSTFSTRKGTFDVPGDSTDVPIATCGAAVGTGMFFDEDCDGDMIAGDGVAPLRLIPGTPNPPRGSGVLTVTSPAGSTTHNVFVVGEQASIDVSILKQPASTGATTGDCQFGFNDESLASAIANPRVAVLLVRALDSDGTSIASTLHDWSADDAAKAILWAPQTFTRDLSAFGLTGSGSIQLVCGNVLAGTDQVSAMTSETISFDPAAGQAHESVSVQISQDPALPSPTPSHTPIVPTSNTVAIDANIANGAGPCATLDQTGITAAGQKHRVAVCVVNFGGEPVGAFSYFLPQGGSAALQSIELPPGGAGVDDNPDANAGATTFSSPSLGDGWICVGIGGLQPNGTYSGPCSRTDQPATLTSGPLGVVTFRALSPGTSTLGIQQANVVDDTLDEIGSCNPTVETSISCVGAQVHILSLPTASPTPTPFATNTVVLPTLTHTPTASATATNIPAPTDTATPTDTPTLTHTTPTASPTATNTPSPTRTSAPVASPTAITCAADVTGDGRVTVRDIVFAARAMRRQDLRADVNGDGRVSVADLKLVVSALIRGGC